MGFLSNMFSDFLYAPAVKADTRRAHERWRRTQAVMFAQRRAEAAAEDAYYTDDMMCGPLWNYWGDGSVKMDPWTKKFYPKGMYLLDSHGFNSALGYGPGLKSPPPGAKRCPK